MNTDWYTALEKPFFAPPPEVFGIAWGIIYPLIFIALLVTLYGYLRQCTVRRSTLGVFALNLVGNVLFMPVQLGLGNQWISFALILFILGTLLYLEYRLYKESRTAFWLLVPYVLWGTFATVLQGTIAVLN